MTSKYRFLRRRLIAAPATVILVATIIFFLFDVIPGDAAQIILGQEGSPEAVSMLRKKLGLDAPVQDRYINWLSHVLSGSLGKSIRTGDSVSRLIGEKLPVTVTLTTFSMILALIVGIPSGILSATRRNSITDTVTSIGTYIGISIPGFWLGIILILVFSVMLNLLPSGGFVSPFVDPVEGLRRLIMPSVTLAAILAAFISRMVRSSILEVLLQEYIVTARSKGLTERLVIYRHALKNALIPVVTVMGFQFGALIGGSVVTEEIFGIGGVGRLMFLGVLDRDLPIVQGVTITIVLVFILTTLMVDIIYMYLDPRVRYD